MRIYIAGPLFNDSERAFNLEVRELCRSLGYDTYLPQEDGVLASARIAAGASPDPIFKEVFERDVAALRESDILLAILNGRVPDEGVCVELGMAHALGKRCIGYKSDWRVLQPYGDNPMITGCLEAKLSSFKELQDYLAP